DAHENALVMRVPGDEALAVIDLNEGAVAGAVARPSHDSGGDRDHGCAGGACEIDALVERLVPGEGIIPLPEIGGDESLGDGPALWMNGIAQIAREDHVLERRELRIAQIHP